MKNLGVKRSVFIKVDFTIQLLVIIVLIVSFVLVQNVDDSRFDTLKTAFAIGLPAIQLFSFLQHWIAFGLNHKRKILGKALIVLLFLLLVTWGYGLFVGPIDRTPGDGFFEYIPVLIGLVVSVAFMFVCCIWYFVITTSEFLTLQKGD